VTFVAFGHHPVDELAGASRRALREFFDHRPEIAGYVTAHTHVSAERTLTLPSGRQIPELIVGSTTDPPQAARLIEVQVSGADLAGRRGIAAARQPRVGLASRRLMLDAGEQCADVAAQPADALGYTGYRILRDDTPDLNLGLIDKLSFGLGLSNLARQRAVQTLGAIVVENELVRSLARLYLDAPIQRDTAAESALAQITEHRYAAGDSVAALRPWLQGRRRPKALTDYDAWHDPAIARAIAAAAGGLHRFGPHAALFRGLRGRRDANADARRYFLCHAVHAAAAEARHPRRRRDILYIR
jgi:hypothetical protein